MPSPRFRVVSEGPTDYAVIRRILSGFFDDVNIEVERLPEPSPVASDPDNFGGWNNLLTYLASPRFEAAFPFTDYVVVHIDTDTCQDFGVVTHEGGVLLPDRAIAERVAEKLKAQIGEAWGRIGMFVLFAVSVDSIECWLLGIYAEPGQTSRSLNCLEHLNRALSKTKAAPISSERKNFAPYDRLAKPFSKPKELAKVREQNASLALFLDEVAVIATAKIDDFCPPTA